MNYGSNYRPSIGGETIANSAIEALNRAVGRHQERKLLEEEKARVREREDQQFQLANRKVTNDIAMANVDLDVAQKGREREAAEKAKAEEADQRKRQAVAMLLREHSGGNPEAAAALATMGVPASMISELRPKPAPEEVDREGLAYSNRKGTLRAERDMGAGNWKPQPAPKDDGAVNRTELTGAANDLLLAHIGRAFNNASSPDQVKASDMVKAVMSDPASEPFRGSSIFQRELNTRVQRLIQQEFTTRSNKKGPAVSLGARSMGVLKK